MKTPARSLLLLTALTILPLLFPPPAAAGGVEDAAGSGQKLFVDASLGTNGRTCNSCHTGMGKGDLPFAGRGPFPKVFGRPGQVRTLDQAVQICITGAMKGNPLAWDDSRLTDLVTYVNSLYLKQ